MSGPDYYAELGVARAATEAEIRDSYRRLARRFHPDLNPGDDQALARLKAINTAYEVLSDPERRRAYDRASAPTPAPPAASTEQLHSELAQVNQRLAALDGRLARLGQQQAEQRAESERWERRVGLARRYGEPGLAEAARLRAEQFRAQTDATRQQLEQTRREAGRLQAARRALLAVLEHRS